MLNLTFSATSSKAGDWGLGTGGCGLRAGKSLLKSSICRTMQGIKLPTWWYIPNRQENGVCGFDIDMAGNGFGSPTHMDFPK
jgi:hypothetical protein